MPVVPLRPGRQVDMLDLREPAALAPPCFEPGASIRESRPRVVRFTTLGLRPAGKVARNAERAALSAVCR